MSKREVRKNLSVTPSGRWEKLVFGLPGMWKKKKNRKNEKKGSPATQDSFCEAE